METRLHVVITYLEVLIFDCHQLHRLIHGTVSLSDNCRSMTIRIAHPLIPEHMLCCWWERVVVYDNLLSTGL